MSEVTIQYHERLPEVSTRDLSPYRRAARAKPGVWVSVDAYPAAEDPTGSMVQNLKRTGEFEACTRNGTVFLRTTKK